MRHARPFPGTFSAILESGTYLTAVRPTLERGRLAGAGPAGREREMELAQLLVDAGAALEGATGLVRYALVFVFAAIPVVEVLVVVPIAIGLGLDPAATGVVAFAGNAGSVYALVYGHRRLSGWWSRRRNPDADGADTGGTRAETSDRYARARRLWDRYGLVGLAFGGPILTGVHVAALVALLSGTDRGAIAGWMTLGIAAWTVVLVLSSSFGISLLGLA